MVNSKTRQPDARLRSARMANAGEATGLPVEQAEALLPADLIHDDEVIILLLRPSLLYIPLSVLGSLAVIMIVALVLALISIKFPVVGWNETQAYALGVALGCARMGWQVLEWWSRIYVLTDRRIIRRMGVLRVAVFETQLKNIQHTSVFARLRERFFGLGSIGFATAGTDVFEAFWVMIARPFQVHRIVVETVERHGGHG
jgi:uncharacterized membrane protein YdbT with pleckstrin-like domain